MNKNIFVFLLLGVLFYSCVPQKKFLAQGVSFQTSQDSLQAIIESLNYEKDTFRMALSFERGANTALLITQDRLQDRLDILQLEIDQLGTSATNTEQNLFSDLQQKEREVNALESKIAAVQNVIHNNEQRLNELAEKIQPYIIEIKSDSIEIRERTGQLIIAIGEDALFRKSSTSALITEGKKLLDNVADIMLQYPEMQIQVVGHTDNRDVNRQSLDNWQYSALRAVSVVKYLAGEANLGANRVVAATKSEFAPLQSNETSEGRARNRRIELIIAPTATFLVQKIQRTL